MTSEPQPPHRLYIWTLIGDDLVIAGQFEHHNKVGTFFYANSYIDRLDSYPLDPVNLPLIREREFRTRANGGYFGVLLDAGPDKWGQRVMSQVIHNQPRSPLELLLAAKGNGCGSLRFSLSTADRPRPELHRGGVDIDVLEQAAQSILHNEQIPPALQEAVASSSAMGGARPKASIWIDGQPYLAKFTKADDAYNEVIAEMASLDMARDIGIDVPEHALLRMPVNGRHAIVIKRFDFGSGGHKRHYLSANALLNLYRFQQNSPSCGYPQLASLTRRFCDNPKSTSQELFRRLAFRVLIGDTDDHGRNHGFVFDGKWALAPMFDVLPHLNNLQHQALPMGREGRVRSLNNLLSMPGAFALTRAEAIAVIKDMVPVLRQWRGYFQAAGMALSDVESLSPCFSLVDEAVRL